MIKGRQKRISNEKRKWKESGRLLDKGKKEEEEDEKGTAR